jgi:hypothetical protein
MKTALLCLVCSSALSLSGQAALFKSAQDFTDVFPVDKADLSATGRNRFFALEPGYQLMLEGKEDGQPALLLITVLNQTRTVDGVETRVVEEKETRNGQVVEISRNYCAISRRTSDVY